MATPAVPAAPSSAKVRLCADGCGLLITVGGPRRRYLPGHAPTAARPINPAEFATADLERFYSFIRLADNGQCWAWTGPRDPLGYGRVWFGKRKYIAHRVMWALTHGILPGIIELNHHCDVSVGGIGPGCVRPDHLFESDHAGNAQDAAAKGLLSRVLTAQQVLELRDLHAARRSMSSLARDVGVDISTVQRAVTGITWAHLNGDWTPAPTRSPFCRKGHPFDGVHAQGGHHTCSTCKRWHYRQATVRRAAARPGSPAPEQWNKLKTLCKRGHEFGRTILKSDGRKYRVCLTCRRAASIAGYYRRKAEAAA